MIRLIFALSASVLAAGCSQKINSSKTMSLRSNAFAPPAFEPFCAREPRLCGSTGPVKSINLSEARKAELKTVNSSVNARVRQIADSPSSSSVDVWRVAAGSGDCEDIAILKKKELMQRGWPASVLLLTAVTSAGRGHTVLTVRTNEGDLILDNLNSSVKNWNRTPYRYFARQSQSAHGKWTRIGT